MKTKRAVYDNPPVGCYVDESSGSADDCNRRAIEFAQDYGFKPRRGVWQMGSEGLSWVADEALGYLNDLESRSFMCWIFDDNSLFLSANVEGAQEDCGFVSTTEQQYPDADYRGEWLQVSDHGNATLYMRGPDGQDKEIWGVV